jgi:GT2 family glycosyltransferase
VIGEHERWQPIRARRAPPVRAYDGPVPAARVSAIVLAHRRREEVSNTLDRLADLPVDEVIVVDNASGDGTAELVRSRGDRVQLVEAGRNLGAAGRNLGAQAARGEFLVMLDDDSYPRPGAIEAALAAFARAPHVGLVGGSVRDVDQDGTIVFRDEVGSFDWWLRAGRSDVPPAGLPAFFFPEGACVVRRRAYLEAGGCFPPYFVTVTELDLTIRLLARGWDVRYLPAAEFEHRKARAGRTSGARILRLRVRNQLWYFWLRFPAAVALRRIPPYLAFDLVECARRGAAADAWLGGVLDAWRDRGAIRGRRRPVSRQTARRAELNRGRMHLRYLSAHARRRLPRAWRWR